MSDSPRSYLWQAHYKSSEEPIRNRMCRDFSARETQWRTTKTWEAAEQFGFTNDPRPHLGAVIPRRARLSKCSSRPERISASSKTNKQKLEMYLSIRTSSCIMLLINTFVQHRCTYQVFVISVSSMIWWQRYKLHDKYDFRGRSDQGDSADPLKFGA